jgi:hypothetical protein
LWRFSGAELSQAFIFYFSTIRLGFISKHQDLAAPLSPFFKGEYFSVRKREGFFIIRNGWELLIIYFHNKDITFTHINSQLNSE